MTDNSHSSSVASKAVDALTAKVQLAPLDQKMKDCIREMVKKGREIEGEAEVHNFVQSMIQELHEPDRKVVEECWEDVQQSMQQSKEEQLAPQAKQQLLASVSAEPKEQKEQKEDSFKFDSHSESNSSSYDDIDDDFRKEEMQQQEQHPQ